MLTAIKGTPANNACHLQSSREERGFPGGSMVKNLPANAGDMGSISGSGRSPEEGNGYSLQYSCVGNPSNREACCKRVHGVAKESMGLQKSQT